MCSEHVEIDELKALALAGVEALLHLAYHQKLVRLFPLSKLGIWVLHHTLFSHYVLQCETLDIRPFGFSGPACMQAPRGL